MAKQAPKRAAKKSAKKSTKSSAKKAAKSASKKTTRPVTKKVAKKAAKAPAKKVAAKTSTKKAAKAPAKKVAAKTPAKKAAKAVTKKAAKTPTKKAIKAPTVKAAKTATKKAVKSTTERAARSGPTAGKIDETLFIDAGMAEAEEFDADEEVQEEFSEAQRLAGGGEVLVRGLREHHDTSPILSGGDVDADWEHSDSGEETVGGSAPTPGQDVVDELGEAVGIRYEDNEPLHTTEKLDERDRNRWELDPASSDDYNVRVNHEGEVE
ncbi:MAG TPA: DUF6335 family protein [Blastocatellia bacterium]